MGRGSGQERALSSLAARSQYSPDPNSFDGVAASLEEIYQPLDVCASAEEMDQILYTRMGAKYDELRAQLPQKIKQMQDNNEAIYQSLVPSLPRAAALKAALLRQQFDNSINSLSDEVGIRPIQQWGPGTCQRFLDAEATYQELVELISGHDPIRHEENRKRERAQARSAKAAEERKDFDRRRHFEETVAGIARS